MKWFYNLKRSLRVLIACASWLPFVAVALIFGESMQGAQTALAIVFLAVGVFFTVLAVKSRPKKPKNEPKNDDFNISHLVPPPPNFCASASVLTPKTAARVPSVLPQYNTDVKINLRENCLTEHNIAVGDRGVVRFEKSSIFTSSNGSAHIDGACYVNDIKVGYFPYEKSLRLSSGTDDRSFTVSNIDADNNVVYINIDLPFVIDSKLPYTTKLNGVTFNNRQNAIAESVVGDRLLIKHTPTDDFPHTIEVYNSVTNKSIGVLPNENAEKILKKYKDGCRFDGVITAIFGGNDGRNYGVEVMLLAKI